MRAYADAAFEEIVKAVTGLRARPASGRRAARDRRLAPVGRTAARTCSAAAATTTSTASGDRRHDGRSTVVALGRAPPRASLEERRRVRHDGADGIERARGRRRYRPAPPPAVCWYSRSRPSRRATSCSTSALTGGHLVVRRRSEGSADDQADSSPATRATRRRRAVRRRRRAARRRGPSCTAPFRRSGARPTTIAAAVAA